MKKRQWILAAGILAVAMGGCGGQEETTTTCSSDEYGVKDTQTITAQGDRVTHLKERVEIDFADLGVSEEDLSAVSEEDLKELFEAQIPQLGEEIQGVRVDYTMEGTKAALEMDVDLTNADTEALADMGILDTDTDNISLSLSISGLEEEGYTCQ